MFFAILTTPIKMDGTSVQSVGPFPSEAATMEWADAYAINHLGQIVDEPTICLIHVPERNERLPLHVVSEAAPLPVNEPTCEPLTTAVEPSRPILSLPPKTGEVKYDKDGRMVLRYVSADRHDVLWSSGDGICVACGTVCVGIDLDDIFQTCEACHKPMVFGAKELGARGYVLQPNSCITQHKIDRPRVARGH
jgi:hypothetical protein